MSDKDVKSRLDNYTMILNHLFVIIITVGGSSVKMFIDDNIGFWFYSGFAITLLSSMLYGVVYTKKDKVIKGDKK